MKINTKQIVNMWIRKGYNKEKRIKDLESIRKIIIKNPDDYFHLLVYTEYYK